MDYLPLFHNLKQRPCLIIGAGAVAARKISLLQEAGAYISVLAPTVCDSIEQQVSQNSLKHINNRFEQVEQQQFTKYVLIIAATNDDLTNQQISKMANALNIPVNVVDQPHLCSFIFPAIVDRSPLTIAISSGGHAPVLARSYVKSLKPYYPTRLEN